MAAEVKIKRVYDPPARDDGFRVLIDRVWPRGMTKLEAHVDEWARELAPSTELRRWFGHEPARFGEFRKRYRHELEAQSERIDALRTRARKEAITIVYGARDREHNNAVVLSELVRKGAPDRKRTASQRQGD